MPPRLRVYIDRACSNCRYAQAMARMAQAAYPQIVVELIDVHEREYGDDDGVFAVPTYQLNGTLLSLGNPDWESLRSRLERVTATSQ